MYYSKKYLKVINYSFLEFVTICVLVEYTHKNAELFYGELQKHRNDVFL